MTSLAPAHVHRTLQKAGFSSLWDVLQHYPRDYCQVAAYPWTEEKQRVGVSGTVIWQSIYHGSDTLVVEVVLGNVHLDDGTPLPTGRMQCPGHGHRPFKLMRCEILLQSKFPILESRSKVLSVHCTNCASLSQVGTARVPLM